MNLKSIMTTAGVALLSFCLAGVSIAKPVTAPTATVSAAAQDEPDCTFAYAIVYGHGCWVRVDTCGDVEVHGCLDEAALVPQIEQTPAQTTTQAAFLPAWLKETD